MKDYYTGADDNGGVHINSGIPDHVFYLVATALGGNAWDKAGRIWYDTLCKKPSSECGFQRREGGDAAVGREHFRDRQRGTECRQIGLAVHCGCARGRAYGEIFRRGGTEIPATIHARHSGICPQTVQALTTLIPAEHARSSRHPGAAKIPGRGQARRRVAWRQRGSGDGSAADRAPIADGPPGVRADDRSSAAVAGS